MTATPVAYELHGMTFCPSCALKATALGMLMARLPLPQDMDEAIASIALAQIERGLPIDTPVAAYSTDEPECDSCDHKFNREEVK